MNTKITEYKTKRINKLTGGVVGSHKIPSYPESCPGEGVLSNSFLTKNGEYIGDYSRGWWYVKHSLKVCEDYPHGAAEVHKNNQLIGYCGYTHRGASTFKVGDRLFDEKYQPIKEDYEEAQWNEWEAYFNKKREEGDDFDRDSIYDNISAVIPFKMRGIIITNLKEAKKAAINLSKYLS